MDDYTDSAMSVIQQLTTLAANFGPFLFAVLFILLITGKSGKLYREVVSRSAPPATADEVKTHRLYFICCAFIGFVLVFISVAWWVYSHTRPQVYQFVIQNLKENQNVMIENASNAYWKTIPRDPPFMGGPRTKDQFFAIVPNSPLSVGQIIRIQFWETAPQTAAGGLRQEFPPVKSLQVKYAGNHMDTFRYDPDNSQLIGE